ncbi:polysaccharide deacetylase [Endozoicomonas montiporae]|uniref:Polysaccharide deacetylase n=2 Tax=Endozoicomonas montiporae TaxID=1027273 RepID=A0A081N0E6_9GAMM|nr:polysaccharide deacetylase family protein [Endozoicomonas montiporae]AMO54375.1 polysaccharide deacetylase [Endozoicomonas montiporae CL-33]KEQ11919.1 polysaccharide deacetylase [Endozoicomonas montiporae]
MQGLRNILFKGLVRSGATRAASYFHRHHVTILCFHSISLEDEHRFWPGVFVSKDKLTELLDYLQQSHYNVISLQEAERHLRGEVTYQYPVVITIDDGWFSSVSSLLPVLSCYQFPATLYVTTYYCNHQIPVVNVLLQYWLWKKPAKSLDVEYDGKRFEFTGDKAAIVRSVEQTISAFTDQQKMQFLKAIAASLNVDGRDITSRRFHNANYSEIAAAASSPLVDIQLHTHTHRLPNDDAGIEREVQVNKNTLSEQLKIDSGLDHFCYPSGIWSPEQIPYLEQLGIKTATTLDEGLNSRQEHLLKLKRNLIMDSRSLDQLRVTMSGTLDVMRRLKKKVRA